MSHDQNTIDYFDLIVQIGKVVADQTPEHLNTKSYMRSRIEKAWHRVNTNLRPGSSGAGLLMTPGHRRAMASMLGDLAREALIAAWYLGIQYEDGEDDGEAVARIITEATVESQVRL